MRETQRQITGTSTFFPLPFFLFYRFHLSRKITHYVPIVLTTISHTRFLAGHGLSCLNPTNLYLADSKIPLAPGISAHPSLDLYSHISFTVMFYVCLPAIACLR